jgi:hypothetical protein
MAQLISAADLHGIRVAFIIIIFWVAIWGLAEETITTLEKRHGLKRWTLYLGLLVLSLLFIVIDPYTFESLI